MCVWVHVATKKCFSLKKCLCKLSGRMVKFAWRILPICMFDRIFCFFFKIRAGMPNFSAKSAFYFLFFAFFTFFCSFARYFRVRPSFLCESQQNLLSSHTKVVTNQFLFKKSFFFSKIVHFDCFLLKCTLFFEKTCFMTKFGHFCLKTLIFSFKIDFLNFFGHFC